MWLGSRETRLSHLGDLRRYRPGVELELWHRGARDDGLHLHIIALLGIFVNEGEGWVVVLEPRLGDGELVFRLDRVCEIGVRGQRCGLHDDVGLEDGGSPSLLVLLDHVGEDAVALQLELGLLAIVVELEASIWDKEERLDGI